MDNQADLLFFFFPQRGLRVCVCVLLFFFFFNQRRLSDEGNTTKTRNLQKNSDGVYFNTHLKKKELGRKTQKKKSCRYTVTP